MCDFLRELTYICLPANFPFAELFLSVFCNFGLGKLNIGNSLMVQWLGLGPFKLRAQV